MLCTTFKNNSPHTVWVCVQLQTVPLCAHHDQTACFLSCHDPGTLIGRLCHFVPGSAGRFPSDIITVRRWCSCCYRRRGKSQQWRTLTPCLEGRWAYSDWRVVSSSVFDLISRQESHTVASQRSKGDCGSRVTMLDSKRVCILKIKPVTFMFLIFFFEIWGSAENHQRGTCWGRKSRATGGRSQS